MFNCNNVVGLEMVAETYCNGMYYEYDIDTFESLLHDSGWVEAHKAEDERDYIVSQITNLQVSSNAKRVYVPVETTAENITSYIASRFKKGEPQWSVTKK